MKEAMEETGRAVAHDLEKYLSALGTIASLAPLMGLFGTVVGMIEIFGRKPRPAAPIRSNWRTASPWPSTTRRSAW